MKKFFALILAFLFAACTDYQDVFEDAFGDLEYAEEVDDSSSSTEASSSDIEEKSSSSKAKSSSSREESSSSKAKSSSSKEESSSSKAKSSSSSEESSSSSSSSSVERDSVATLSMLMVYATDPTDAEASPLLSKDSAGLADSSSFNLAIQAPTAYIKFKTNAKKVAQVKVSAGKDAKIVHSDSNEVYSFKQQLTILDTTSVEIEVKSEDGESFNKYTLSISSTLAPPTNLKLGKDANRKKINVLFDRSADTRVDGYVVLRSDRGSDGKQGDDLPDSIENKTKIENGGTYNGFVSFLAEADSGVYVDSVGGGSPYYAYRVYAYTKEGDDMVFSEGTEQSMRSVGRIMVEYKMTDFGSEYLICSSGLNRADISATVSLHEGDNNSANKLSEWYMFDGRAGSLNQKYTVIYLSKEFYPGEEGDRKPDETKRTSIIGKNGLYLYFEIIAECHGSGNERATQGIRWPYERIASVLNGDSNLATGKNGDAPKRIALNKDLKEDVEYLVGKGGIEYNDRENECDEDDCGDEPHAGFWFGFKSEWIGDADFYYPF